MNDLPSFKTSGKAHALIGITAASLPWPLGSELLIPRPTVWFEQGVTVQRKLQPNTWCSFQSTERRMCQYRILPLKREPPHPVASHLQGGRLQGGGLQGGSPPTGWYYTLLWSYVIDHELLILNLNEGQSLLSLTGPHTASMVNWSSIHM